VNRLVHQIVTIGGIRMVPSLSFSAADDDNFKLWGYFEGTAPVWNIVYCWPFSDSDEMDYRYWSGSEWQTEQGARRFTPKELETQVPLAWAKRETIT